MSSYNRFKKLPDVGYIKKLQEHLNNVEIAERYGVTRQAVTNALRRDRQKKQKKD